MVTGPMHAEVPDRQRISERHRMMNTTYSSPDHDTHVDVLETAFSRRIRFTVRREGFSQSEAAYSYSPIYAIYPLMQLFRVSLGLIIPDQKFVATPS